jgi:hypothetical protein
MGRFMTPLEALAQAELHNAISRIEAALHLAFSPRLDRGGGGSDGEGEGDESVRDELAAALAELDRLEAIARCSGANVEQWLRDSGAGMLDISLFLSRRIRAEPRRSLEAQAGRARSVLRNLRG